MKSSESLLWHLQDELQNSIDDPLQQLHEKVEQCASQCGLLDENPRIHRVSVLLVVLIVAGAVLYWVLKFASLEAGGICPSSPGLAERPLPRPCQVLGSLAAVTSP